jgi:MFS family permease
VLFSALADKTGAKPVYLGSMSAGAIFSMAFALLARGHFSALILYTLVGISMGGTYTTALILLADHYPPSHRGRVTGALIASTSCGYALSLILSGVTIPLGGYKLSFLITCLGPVAGALVAWVTVGKTRVRVPQRSVEQNFIREVVQNKPAMLLIGGYTFHNWELLGMWAWTPAFLASCLAAGGVGQSMSVGLGSYITASFHVTGLLAALSMGALSDRLGRSQVMVALALMSTVCSFIFGWTIHWPFVLAIAIGVMYAFSALGDSPVLSAALTEVVPAPYLGAALGLRSLLGFGAGAVSPIVFGVVLDATNCVGAATGYYGTWGWAFSVLGVAGIGATYAAYRYGRRSQVRGTLP